jgi:hypothetical protein
MSRKRFSTLFNEDMLQLFDFELRPFDQIIPAALTFDSAALRNRSLS